MRGLRLEFQLRLPMLILPSLALVLGVGLSSRAFAQHHVTRLLVKQTATQSLTLIKPTDPNFDNVLDTYFPGLSDEDGYQQAIRPFLVIVRNDAAMGAVAYAITWVAPNPRGWINPLRAIFVTRPLMYGPARTYIPPEGLRLISPLYNVTPQKYAGTPSFTQIYPASRFPSASGVTSIDTEVDGVEYADGTFIGPDTTHVLQRYVAERFAARDEAMAALDFIKSSTEPPLVGQQLLQSLSQEMQQGGRATQDTFLARYVRARGRSAQDLQAILGVQGVSGLETLLQTFLNRTGGSGKPSMFDATYRKLSSNDSRIFSPIPAEGNKP